MKRGSQCCKHIIRFTPLLTDPRSPESRRNNPIRLDLFLFSLAIGLGGIVALVDDEILRAVVFSAGEVALKDGLGASGISFLGIDGCARHVRNHGVSASPGVLGSSQRVVSGSGLREPHITAIAVELTSAEGLGDIFLDDNGATSGVDEPGTW